MYKQQPPKFIIFLPVLTLITFIILGIIYSKFILSDKSYTLWVIIISFIIGMFLSAIELRFILKLKSRSNVTNQLSDKEIEWRMAKYVANLFDEDIPFDKLEKNNN